MHDNRQLKKLEARAEKPMSSFARDLVSTPRMKTRKGSSRAGFSVLTSENRVMSRLD